MIGRLRRWLAARRPGAAGSSHAFCGTRHDLPSSLRIVVADEVAGPMQEHGGSPPDAPKRQVQMRFDALPGYVAAFGPETLPTLAIWLAEVALREHAVADPVLEDEMRRFVMMARLCRQDC